MSLADFVKPRCPVCALPEHLQVEMSEGYSNGIRYKAMVTWLETEHAVAISAMKIETHFKGSHHARKS